MTAGQPDPLAPAMLTAHEWLARVAEQLGTQDYAHVYRLVRAWLHTVRDRLTVVGAARLSAQLPEVWRGVFFEGWQPTRVPVGHGTRDFLTQFATESRVAENIAPACIGLITSALDELFSPGQLDHVFAVLPADLCTVLAGDEPKPIPWPKSEPAAIADLEERLRLLGDAIAMLAGGLEDLPVGTAGTTHGAEAAQQAHRMLLAQGLTSHA